MFISVFGHVIVVISKNVTASQAETILTMLTHNATGGRIGNNVTISPTALYLLHLPNDILSAIPTSVMSSGMGEGPNYYSIGSVIGDIAGMAFDFLVWVATGGVLLLFVHLVEMGLEALGNLLAAAASAVQDAVDAIVDAFCAFVDWAIDVLIDLFNQFVLEPLSALWTSIQNWIVGFAHLIRVNLDGIANGTISFTEAELSMIGYFIDSDTFVLMLVVMTAFLAAMTVLQVAIAPAAFLIGLLAPVIIDLVLMGIAAAIGGYHWLVDSIGGLFSGFIDDAASFLSSEGVQSSMTVITLLAAFGDMFMSKMDMFMKIGDNNGALEKKKQSVFGFIISCFGLGWTMSEHAIHDLDENDKKNYRYLSERPRPRLWSVFMQRRK